MSYLEESYLITSDDENSSVTVSKDVFGNLSISLKERETSSWTTLVIPEELVTQFVYAINRLVNP